MENTLDGARFKAIDPSRRLLVIENDNLADAADTLLTLLTLGETEIVETGRLERAERSASALTQRR